MGFVLFTHYFIRSAPRDNRQYFGITAKQVKYNEGNYF